MKTSHLYPKLLKSFGLRSILGGGASLRKGEGSQGFGIVKPTEKRSFDAKKTNVTVQEASRRLKARGKERRVSGDPKKESAFLASRERGGSLHRRRSEQPNSETPGRFGKKKKRKHIVVAGIRDKFVSTLEEGIQKKKYVDVRGIIPGNSEQAPLHARPGMGADKEVGEKDSP